MSVGGKSAVGAREKAINSDYQLEALIINEHGQQKHGAPRSSVFYSRNLYTP